MARKKTPEARVHLLNERSNAALFQFKQAADDLDAAAEGLVFIAMESREESARLAALAEHADAGAANRSHQAAGIRSLLGIA